MRSRGHCEQKRIRCNALARRNYVFFSRNKSVRATQAKIRGRGRPRHTELRSLADLEQQVVFEVGCELGRLSDAGFHRSQ